MTLHQTFFAMALVGIVSVGTSSSAAAQKPDRLQVASTLAVPANSPQLRAVRQWLAQRSAPHAPGVGLDVAAWRSAVVTSSGRAVSLDDATTGDGNPFALLPAAGSPGERVRVDAVTKRGRESWSYEWAANATPDAWVLERYAFDAAAHSDAVKVAE